MTVRILFVLAVVVALGTGCPSKPNKPADTDNGAGAAQTAEDTNVQNKDLTYDVQGSDSGKIDGLYSIHFDYDKSTLSAEGRSLAQKDAQWMKAHADAKIQIEGHCDRHGSIEYNLALGERRAKTVRHYMEELGVKSSRLSVISYGRERLLEQGETDEADAKNRRANFVVQGQ